MSIKSDLDAEINALNSAYNTRWGGTPVSITPSSGKMYASQINSIIDQTRNSGIHYSSYPGSKPTTGHKIYDEEEEGILRQIRQVKDDIATNIGCANCKGNCHNQCTSGCNGGCKGCSGCSGKCWSCSGGLWCAGCWRECSKTCGGGCNGCNGCNSSCQYGCSGTCTNGCNGYSNNASTHRSGYGTVCDCG